MFRITLFLTLIATAVSTVTAQNIDYSRTVAAGQFRTAQFWSPFDPNFPLIGPGGSTDRAHFDLGHNVFTIYEITNVNGVNDQLIIENDAVNLAMTNYQTVSDSHGSFASVVVGYGVGDAAIAVFSGEDGDVFESVNAVIGSVNGSSGSVFASGDGFQWNNSGNVLVGRHGVGQLVVSFGAYVSSETSEIANGASSTGNATVSGEESEWNLDGWTLRVGARGEGTLVVEDGGYVRCGNGVAGYLPGSSGDVTIDGSTWRTIGDMIIGRESDATMIIENEGLANSFDDSMIGRLPGSSGAVTITGDGSLWDVWGNLGIGGNVSPFANGGSGSLTVEDGGRLLARGGTFLFPNGVLSLDHGSIITTDSIEFVGGGSFNFDGGVLQVGSYEGDLLNNGGILAPGYHPFNMIGSTTIFGDYTQDSGWMEIEISGPTIATEYDTIEVTDETFLDGGLRLYLVPGFIPTADQTFTILESGSLSGFFFNVGDNERLDTIDGSGSFLVRYGVTSPDPDHIVLSDFEPNFVLGDINGDGVVNLLDVAPFVDLINAGGPYDPAADINMDGVLNLLDVAPFIELLSD